MSLKCSSASMSMRRVAGGSRAAPAASRLSSRRRGAMSACADGEPRRVGVPAERREEAAAAVEARVQVDLREAARRALAGFASRGDQQRRPGETLGNFRGHDADDAGVPARVGEDEGAVAEHPRGVLDEPHRFLADLRLDLPAPQVQPLEQVGELARLPHLAGEEEFDGRVGAVEPAGGVDPRAEPEADLGGAQRALFDPGRLQQRPHAGPRGWRRAASRPWCTSTRFSPSSGAMSATVPRATRSR